VVLSLVVGEEPSAAAQAAGKKRQNETSLAGLRPGRDRLRSATNIHGPYFLKPTPGSEREVAWVDTMKRRVLRIELDEKGMIQSVTVSTLDPLLDSPEKKADAPLPSIKLATGRGLRVVHEGYGDVKDTYGEPDDAFEGKRHGISVDVLSYSFDKAPRFLEVSCERGGGRIVQIKLAVEPDPPAK
jgi:hypothetical protein